MERSKLTDFNGIINFLGFIEHDFALENTLKKAVLFNPHVLPLPNTYRLRTWDLYHITIDEDAAMSLRAGCQAPCLHVII